MTCTNGWLIIIGLGGLYSITLWDIRKPVNVAWWMKTHLKTPASRKQAESAVDTNVLPPNDMRGTLGLDATCTNALDWSRG